MKKPIALMLVVMLVITLCACGSGQTQSEDNTTEISSSDVSDEILTENSSPEQSSESSVSYEITDSRARTWTNRIGSVWVQTIIEIKNTGTTNLYLSSGSYDLEDASGKLVASQKMVSAYPNVLAPGEKGYMYEETTLNEAVDGELTVLPHEDVEEATVDLIRFPVTDVEISNDTYGSVKMLGRIENTSDEEESMIYIVAFLYDANGSCIGQMFTILLEDLAAGDKIGFEMSGFSLPDDITTETIADFVIYAYPMQYQF